MAVEFMMPKLGLTMESGTILEWLVDDGAEVEQGSAVLVIETDKVESEVEASGSGLLHIVGTKGDSYACGDTIGWFLDPGEEAPAVVTPAKVAPSMAAVGVVSTAPTAAVRSNGGRLLASPNAKRVAAERGVDLRRVSGSGPGGRIVSEDVLTAPAGGDVPATPAARQLADLLGVDLADVASAGPDPRVGREDVARFAREQLAGGLLSNGSAPAPELPLLQQPSATIPLTGMRGTIASRMHASLRDMAQLTLTMDAVMDAVIADRNSGYETKPGFTDYVIAAAAEALVEHPVVNSQIADGAVNLLPDINVGLAVALDGGLVVPVVSRTNERTLLEVSSETTRLATAAREGGLALADLEGGTFSVTALGMFGVDAFTPVINPPNTAILGVGRLRDGIRWDGDVPVKTTMLTLSLTWDHRAFDGAPAAEFAATVRDRLESWGDK